MYQAALRGEEVVRPERVHLKLNLRSELRLRLVLPPSVPSAGSTQPARAGVSILFFFQMAEISSSFGGGAGVGPHEEGGRPETPTLAYSRSGCTFPPCEFRKIGEINATAEGRRR